MLIYAIVNYAFSSFVRLKLALVIQLPTKMGLSTLLLDSPLNVFGFRGLLLSTLLLVAGELELCEASLNQEVVPSEALLHV